jgi:integrase
VLLLLARLGLRAGEVGHLSLEDIDWQAGVLTVRGKSSRSARLPLPVAVGEALATYLRSDGPAILPATCLFACVRRGSALPVPWQSIHTKLQFME